MSGIWPAQFRTSCGAKISVSTCRHVLEIASRGDPELMNINIARAAGISMSPEPGCAAGSDSKLFWLAPGRWWLTGDAETPQSVSLPGASVTDIGDAVMRLQIRGASARDWLSRSCPIDLRAKSFGDDRVAWTTLCESRVLLHCIKEGVFDLYVDRSLCQHIADALF